MATIACEQCSATRTGCPSNTKLCKECGRLRDVTFWHGRTRECTAAKCAREFTPLHRSDRLCGHCDRSPLRGPCRWCKAENAELVGPDVPVCFGCAKDPALRLELIDGLRAKQDERRAANA